MEEVAYIEPESFKKYYRSNQIIHIHMKQHQVVTIHEDPHAIKYI